MKDEAHPDFVLREYGHHSVYTTWAISFECVKRKNETEANFLQVWSCLDNRDIWCDLFPQREELKSALGRQPRQIGSRKLLVTRSILEGLCGLCLPTH